MYNEKEQRQQISGWTGNLEIRKDPLYISLTKADLTEVKAHFSSHKNIPDPKDYRTTIFLIATEKTIIEKNPKNRASLIEILKFLAEKEKNPFFCSIVAPEYNPFYAAVVKDDLEVFKILLNTKNLPPMFEELLIDAVKAIPVLEKQTVYIAAIKEAIANKYPTAWQKILSKNDLSPNSIGFVKVVLEQLNSNSLFNYDFSTVAARTGKMTEPAFMNEVQKHFKELEQKESTSELSFSASYIKDELSKIAAKYPGLSAKYQTGIEQINGEIDSRDNAHRLYVEMKK